MVYRPIASDHPLELLPHRNRHEHTVTWNPESTAPPCNRLGGLKARHSKAHDEESLKPRSRNARDGERCRRDTAKPRGRPAPAGRSPGLRCAKRKSPQRATQHHTRAFCAALSGLNSMIAPDTQGSRARCRGLFHPGLCYAAPSALRVNCLAGPACPKGLQESRPGLFSERRSAARFKFFRTFLRSRL